MVARSTRDGPERRVPFPVVAETGAHRGSTPADERADERPDERPAELLPSDEPSATGTAGPAPQRGEADPETAYRSSYARVRRAPRYGPFILTGAVVGLVAAIVVILLARDPHPPVTGVAPGLAPEYSLGQLVAYVGAFGVVLGGLVGAVVALVVERRRGPRR